MNKVILKIGGMSCSACSNRLEKHLNSKEGILKASVNLVLSEAVIEYDDTLTLKDLESFVKEAGYESLGLYEEKKSNKPNHTRVLLILLGLLALLIMYIAMGDMFHLPVIINKNTHYKTYALTLLILTIPFLVYSFDILKKGIKNLIHKSPNMDTLVTLGVLSSFFYSLYNLIIIFLNKGTPNLYFESSALVLYFIKIGRYIEQKSKDKTKKALEQLVTITPEYAYLKVNDEIKKVTIDEVKKGDILVCKPGDKVAVDGEVIKGEAYLDEAFLTGEARPSKKEVNSKVLAGSINYDGYIEYTAEKIGQESTISQIVRLVLEATATKAKVARLADIVSSYFTQGLILIALATFICYLALNYEFNVALNHFVSILVVSCPCALGLATPLALVVSLGTCAEAGLLIKSSEVLEKVNSIDTIVFDKTGTLTFGNLKIAKIFNYSKESEEEILTLISSVESLSNHPIASAFKSYAKDHKLNLLEVNNFKNLNGLGLTGTINNSQIYLGNAQILQKLNIKNVKKADEQSLTKSGHSIVYLVKDQELVALIGVKDIIRPTTKLALSNLKKLNKELIMLTGDNLESAKFIAQDLALDQIQAGLTPQEKTQIIKSLEKKGKKVMMVGDGINDAPSLATSTLAVSIESATDIAIDSADVIILNNNLDLLTTLFKISNKTLKIIKENLFWAFFYNVLMIPIAMGLFTKFNLTLNPMLASLAMTFSSLTVVFNSLRLKRGAKC